MNARHNIADLTQAMRTYRALSKMSTEDVLRKQGGKLVREISFQLRYISPPKGSVVVEGLSRLRMGKGIKIRPAIRSRVVAQWEDKLKRKQARFEDKFWGEAASGQNNWKWLLQQKLVQAELNMRERGRGVMGISAKYPQTLTDQGKSISRYGHLLSEVGVRVLHDKGFARLSWPGINEQSKKLVEGLGRRRPSKAVADAIHIVTEDILVYTRGKQKEMVAGWAKSITRKGGGGAGGSGKPEHFRFRL